MAVTRCALDDKPGSDTCEVDANFVRRHMRRYIVTCNSRAHTSYDVMLAASVTGPHHLPWVYEPHPTDPTSYARKAKCTRGEEGMVYYVDVEFDNQIDTTRNVENPLERPPIIDLVWQPDRKPIERDKAGNLICTTAGQPIIPAVEIDQSRALLTIERNEASFPLVTSGKYQDAINTDTFYGWKKGTCKMSIRIGPEEVENDIRFRKVRYEIHYDRDGWIRPILNIGTKYLDDDGNLVPIGGTDEPVFLDRDGKLLNGTGEPPPPTGFESASDAESAQDDQEDEALDQAENGGGSKGPDQPVYINPPIYKRMAYGPLNLEYSLLPIT